MVYADKADLPATIQRLALGEEQVASALAQASSTVDGFLAARFVLPMKQVGSDIKRFTVNLAAYNLAIDNGLNVDDPANRTFKDRYDDAMKLLKGIADGTYSPQGVADSAGNDGDEYGGQATVMYPPQATRVPGEYDGAPSSTPKPRGF